MRYIIIDNLYYAHKYFKEGVGLKTPSDFSINDDNIEPNSFISFLFNPNFTTDICYKLTEVTDCKNKYLKFRLSNSNLKLLKFANSGEDYLQLEQYSQNIKDWFQNKDSINDNSIPFYIRFSIAVYYLLAKNDLSVLSNLTINDSTLQTNSLFELEIMYIQYSRMLHYLTNNYPQVDLT